MTEYRLAPGVELVEREGGWFLVAKAPLSVLRLNKSLVDLLRRSTHGPISAGTPVEAAVLEQLTTKGFMERSRNSGEMTSGCPTVSVVIPVKDRAGELRRCLQSIACLHIPAGKIEVVVVDDGSSDDSPDVAREAGAAVVPSGGSGRGPAAARNVGARAARGEILAFIDSDCTASQRWLAELLPLFNDPKTAAVGGMVDGMCTVSAVDRYEAVMSSLSLGLRERSGSDGDDTFYLPSCNLLVRRDAFMGVGGFDDSMHVGEDVDLTWRLRDNGWTIRYLPAGRVFHEHRSTIRSFMSRRFDYGTSEGLLQNLHPLRKKRLVIPPLLAVLLALCVAAPVAGPWTLLAAAGVLATDATVARIRFSRRKLPIAFHALVAGRLRAAGSLFYYLCYHLVRYYIPLLVLLALIAPVLWAVPAIALVTAAGVDFSIKKPDMPFVPFMVVYLLEQMAYGAGVFWGCVRWRSFTTYRVTLLRKAGSTA